MFGITILHKSRILNNHVSPLAHIFDQFQRPATIGNRVSNNKNFPYLSDECKCCVLHVIIADVAHLPHHQLHHERVLEFWNQLNYLYFRLEKAKR